MQSNQSHSVFQAGYFCGAVARRRPRRGGLRRWAAVSAVFAAAFTCVAQDGHSAGAQAEQPNGASQARVNPPADAKSQVEAGANARAKEATPQSGVPADSQRRKQISAESTQLLAMAVELKAEVDKTNKDTLSLKVIRKADAIEKLAKTVKEKMKQSSGPS